MAVITTTTMQPNEAITLYGIGNFSIVLYCIDAAHAYPRHNSILHEKNGFDAGLDRFRSPLLTTSQLVSLAPDSNMLKFSGYPAAPRCYSPDNYPVLRRDRF